MSLWDTIASKINGIIYAAQTGDASVLATAVGKPAMKFQIPLLPPGAGQQDFNTLFNADGLRGIGQPKTGSLEKLKGANQAAKNAPNANNNTSESVGNPPCPSEEQVDKQDCCAKITNIEMRAVFPLADPLTITQLLITFNDAFDKFNIDTCLRKAHFFAQVLQEVGVSASVAEESLNYTPTRLVQVFGYFKRNAEEAQLFGRTVEGIADQQAIANRAYANRLGNGDVESGDGWKFRGKGFLQLTGKSNYAEIQQEIDTRFPGSAINILENESDILTVKGALLSAMAFWSKNSIDALADAGEGDEVVDSVTAVINLKTDSYEARRSNFLNSKNIFNISGCKHNMR